MSSGKELDIGPEVDALIQNNEWRKTTISKQDQEIENLKAIVLAKDKEIERIELLMHDSIARTAQDSTVTAPLREYFRNKERK